MKDPSMYLEQMMPLLTNIVKETTIKMNMIRRKSQEWQMLALQKSQEWHTQGIRTSQPETTPG